jgi:hypothetical protein
MSQTQESTELKEQKSTELKEGASTPEDDAADAAKWRAIRPTIAKLDALAGAGWYHVDHGDNLVEALIRELCVVRAEASIAPVIPNLMNVLVGAFGMMCSRMNQSLGDVSKTLQQHRYAAFEEAVKPLVPLFTSHGRVHAFSAVQSILQTDIENARKVLAVLKGPDGAPSTVRQRRSELVEANIKFMTDFYESINRLTAGGETPQQIINRMREERAPLGDLPHPNAVN